MVSGLIPRPIASTTFLVVPVGEKQTSLSDLSLTCLHLSIIPARTRSSITLPRGAFTHLGERSGHVVVPMRSWHNHHNAREPRHPCDHPGPNSRSGSSRGRSDADLLHQRGSIVVVTLVFDLLPLHFGYCYAPH
jgi:hypothetical protein